MIAKTGADDAEIKVIAEAAARYKLKIGFSD
jgi:hypothetical protein